jgi:hypothetical protein
VRMRKYAARIALACIWAVLCWLTWPVMALATAVMFGTVGVVTLIYIGFVDD